MAAQAQPTQGATRSVSKEWIENTYIYVIEEALYGDTKPARLSVAAATLTQLARFKGLIIEKKATLSVAVDKMDRAAIRQSAMEMLEQLEPGARAEMRRLLARSESIDVQGDSAESVISPNGDTTPAPKPPARRPR